MTKEEVKEAKEETKENVEEKVEEEDDEDIDAKEKLAFPTAAVVRVMKKKLDKEKMIRKEVKVAMNKWLERMCLNVANQMNKFPYVVMNLNEFKEGVRVYEDLENFDKEKQRILAHFDAMKKDIQRLERDLGKIEEDLVE
ncbi:MAG: histone-like protein [Candidatus Aenigmatarchaeota archaeon]|nr:NFYB/HAP3 family transcription factor subunit [Nanoarchaeota archaeon]